MIFQRFAACAAVLLLSSIPSLAHDGVHINDPYARVLAGSGVVYFQIENMQTVPDTLIAARSDLGMTMLMNNTEDANGVMQMRMVDGFAVDAGQVRVLQPAGDHVMLSGVTARPKTGETITVVLTFATAGDVTVTVPVDNTRRTPPGAGPTPFDVMSAEKGHGDAAVPKGAMSMADTPDQQAIVTVMKAMFDAPDAPLQVDPVVVMGNSAVASWAQGDKAGRALLARQHGVWAVVLCGGPDLRDPAFLAANGVAGAEMLSQMFNAAEDGLGADAVSRHSSFAGVVMMDAHAHN